MACGVRFFKYGLLILNIIFLVVQIFISVLRIYMVFNIVHFDGGPNTNVVYTNGIVLAVISCVLVILALLGCCAAVCENSSCTITYAVFVGITFVLQTAMVIYSWHRHYTFSNNIHKYVENIWDRRDHTTDQMFMHRLQFNLKCCGLYGFDDYLYANESIPSSCCGELATFCDGAHAFENGCANAFRSFYRMKIEILLYAISGVAVLELIIFIFACCLAKQLRKKERRSKY